MKERVMNVSLKVTCFSARNNLLAGKVIKNLQSRNFEAFYAQNAEEALQKATSYITKDSVVACGGSVTLEEIGLPTALAESGCNFIDRGKAQDIPERMDMMRRAFFADVYFTSFNALSEDGVLVNVDSLGNRTAAITFGPKNVVAVVGMNKICKTLEDARTRARTFAAPINAQRCAFDPLLAPVKNTPCMANGSCADCRTADCICSYIVETRMCKIPGRIKIILVDETLGF